MDPEDSQSDQLRRRAAYHRECVKNPRPFGLG